MAVRGHTFEPGVRGLRASHWLRQPAAGAEGRENFSYASLSLRYKPLRWCHLSLALDRRLSADADETIPAMAERGLGELPNYPSWLLNLGLHLKLLPLYIMQTSDEEVIMQRVEERHAGFRKDYRGKKQQGSQPGLISIGCGAERRGRKETGTACAGSSRPEQEQKNPPPDQNL